MSKSNPQEQQIINDLQQSNLGTEKILINVNGKVSRNTNSNSRIQYNLKDPIKLNVGDKITLYQAFLNERGINESTISFEEDITETLRFLYYKQGDVQDAGQITMPTLNPDYPNYGNADKINGGGTSFKMFPTPCQDAYLMTNGSDQDSGKFYSTFCETATVAASIGAQPDLVNIDMRKVNGSICDFNYTKVEYDVYGRILPENLDDTKINLGCNGQMYYLYESCSFAGQVESNNLYPEAQCKQFENAEEPSAIEALNKPRYQMRPVYGKAQIKIKAGNYSVDALANLIKEQLNGSLGVEDDTLQSLNNALTEKLFNPAKSSIKSNFGNMRDTTPYFNNIAQSPNNIDAEYLVNDNKYWNTDNFERTNGGMVVDLKTMMPNANGGNWATLCYNQTMAQGLCDEEDVGGKFDFQQPENRDVNASSNVNLTHAELLFAQTNRQTSFGQTDVDYKTNFYMSDIYTNLWEIGAQHGYSHDGVLWAGGKYSIGFTTESGDPEAESSPVFNFGLPQLDMNNEGDLSYILRGFEQPLIGANYNSIPDGSIVDKVNMLPIEDQACMSGFFPVQNITTTLSGSESEGLRYFGGGTSQFDITYDTSIANRYAFTNCHQPYLLPNMAFITTSDGTKQNIVQSSLAGTQATKYNNTFSVQPKDPSNRNITAENPMVVDMFGRNTAQYPIDSTSGICINNFAFERVKNTTVYKKLVGSTNPDDPYYNYKELLPSGRIKGSLAYYDSIVDTEYDPTANYEQIDCNFVQNTPDRNNVGFAEDGTTLRGRRGAIPMQREAILFELFTKKFEDFFENDIQAQEEWNKSLWARMGFSYDQLGKISDKLETRSTYGFGKKLDELPLKGIITHNSFDFSTIVSTEGLGGGNPVQGGSAPNYDGTGLQNYFLAGYYNGSSIDPYTAKTLEYNINSNIFHNQEDSKYIYAKNLPDLNDGNSYYLVESDIIKNNYRDANNTKASLVGVISKQESTADTLFSVDGVEFTNTEERLLTSINLDIKNPDGTRASEDLLGQNSGFIFMIERAIQPQNIEMKEI
jgi:hypothetical protein